MTILKYRLIAGLTASALVCAAALAAGAGSVIATRQAGFKAIGRAMKDVAGELRAPSPNLATIRLAAATIERGSTALPRWFPRGSGAEAGIKTAAKPDIWAQPGDFQNDARAFATAARGLRAASATGTPDLIRAQAKQLGEACAACHKQFRNDD